MRVPRNLLGIDKVVYLIEGLLINSEFLRKKFYLSWMILDVEDRKGFKGEVKKVIREELLGEEFLEALARDVFREGKIHQTEVYRYVRDRIWRREGKELLQRLREIEKRSKEREIKDGG